MLHEALHRSPVCLLMTGSEVLPAHHWMSVWSRERPECELVELGCRHDPIRNIWISRIDQAVRAAEAPIVIVAHDLACLALLWWASLLGEDAAGPVCGALLVAPPDVDRASATASHSRFAPRPRQLLPFPSILVASAGDPYAAIERSQEMARDWGAAFVATDVDGHIDAHARLGAWEEGQTLLDILLDETLAAEQARPARPLSGRVRLPAGLANNFRAGLPRQSHIVQPIQG